MKVKDSQNNQLDTKFFVLNTKRGKERFFGYSLPNWWKKIVKKEENEVDDRNLIPLVPSIVVNDSTEKGCFLDSLPSPLLLAFLFTVRWITN